jgi:hypothetical protein
VKTLVQLKQRAVARRNVHAINVEITLVPLIVRDQQFARKTARALLNVACHPRSRRQRAHAAGFEIDPPRAPIFVASRLTEEHDMPIVVHPENPGAKIAVGHRRHGARIINPIDRRNPKIEHAVNGRTEGKPRAVPTDPHDASLRIFKNQAAGKQTVVLFSDPWRGDRLIGHSRILE